MEENVNVVEVPEEETPAVPVEEVAEAPAQEEIVLEEAKETDGEAPKSGSKKKLLPIILGAVAACVLLVVALFAFGGSSDEVNLFNEGLVPVLVDGRYGYANTKGEIVINPQFEEADIFSGGLACVNTGNRTAISIPRVSM